MMPFTNKTEKDSPRDLNLSYFFHTNIKFLLPICVLIKLKKY
jgi:hypothetical protein